MPPVSIRAALPSDYPAYQSLRLEALQQHPDAFLADYETQASRPAEYWRDNLQTHIDNPANIIYFATVDQELAGMVGIRREINPKLQHTAHIWGVYVRAAWRGQRVADQLVTHCLDWARSQQVRIVKLGVIARNSSAIRCYLRCGFSVYGVDPEVIFIDGAYHDELLMARRLV